MPPTEDSKAPSSERPGPCDGEQIRKALVRQWKRIAEAVPQIDLDHASRLDGWRNREVLAHLYVQPFMLSRFLKSASHQEPSTQLLENLSSTKSFSELIDASAREGAKRGKYNFGVALEATLPDLLDAHLDRTVTTLQGSISLVDYLVTRCIEAVIHGGDLVPPVDPDRQAEAIAADALKELLAIRSAHLLPEAERLSTADWIAVATGRHTAIGNLASVVPVMH